MVCARSCTTSKKSPSGSSGSCVSLGYALIARRLTAGSAADSAADLDALCDRLGWLHLPVLDTYIPHISRPPQPGEYGCAKRTALGGESSHLLKPFRLSSARI